MEYNNRTIILCMTKIQLNFIYDNLKSVGINAVKLYSEENVIDKENDNVIVATFKYASKAFDYKQLNRLILAVPILGKKGLIQCIGRIIRKCENKIDAIVYDLIDIDSNFGGIFINSIKSKINILKNEYDNCIFNE
jgi:superfamily II DNA or RNA helicase